mmetsp:Transcript_122527/g.318517  ORF Transcript_122527/g.318517 Transcript_122527/m.318517 type:complete len:267 (-) Transcript_122527:367-1167(-)
MGCQAHRKVDDFLIHDLLNDVVDCLLPLGQCCLIVAKLLQMRFRQAPLKDAFLPQVGGLLKVLHLFPALHVAMGDSGAVNDHTNQDVHHAEGRYHHESHEHGEQVWPVSHNRADDFGPLCKQSYIHECQHRVWQIAKEVGVVELIAQLRAELQTEEDCKHVDDDDKEYDDPTQRSEGMIKPFDDHDQLGHCYYEADHAHQACKADSLDRQEDSDPGVMEQQVDVNERYAGDREVQPIPGVAAPQFETQVCLTACYLNSEDDQEDHI